jgi:calcineurin-like phosphoesterase family protein
VSEVHGLPLTLISYFGHANVIKSCNRPFSSVEEMNEGLIANWNSVVKNGDEVWHIGDFAWKENIIPGILKRLNGSIHLVRGNHDAESHEKLLKFGFASVHEAYYMRRGDDRIYLHHYACRVWRNSVHGAWHLFGHSHGNRDDLGKSTDVGVDCWNFTPVSVETLREKFRDCKNIDHHKNEYEQ